MNEPRVYQHSPVTLVFIFVLLLFMFGAIFLGFGVVLQSPLILIALGAFLAILAVFSIHSYTTKTIVSEEELTKRTLLGSKTLRWTEISRVSGTGYNLKLHNFDGDVTIALSPRLPGYEDIIEWVGRQRADLFLLGEYSEMRRSVGALVGTLIATAALLGVTGAFLWSSGLQSLSSTDTLFPLLFLAAILLFVVGGLFSSPQSVSIEGGMLRLKYLLSEKAFNVNEIAAIALSYTQTRNGRQYFIALQLTSRKVLRISRLNIGLPIAYLVLKHWHKKNT